MPLTISPDQRKALVRCKLRPASLAQYYAARSLLALGKGEPLALVAKAVGKPESRVERWAAGFEERGVAYVRALGRKAAGRSGAVLPGVDALLRMKARPAPEGLDLDADPADLY